MIFGAKIAEFFLNFGVLRPAEQPVAPGGEIRLPLR
jgi:hypothetical protein